MGANTSTDSWDAHQTLKKNKIFELKKSLSAFEYSGG